MLCTIVYIVSLWAFPTIYSPIECAKLLTIIWDWGIGYKNIPRPWHPFHSVTSTGFIIFKLSKMFCVSKETVVHVPNSFSGMLCGIPLMTSRWCIRGRPPKAISKLYLSLAARLFQRCLTCGNTLCEREFSCNRGQILMQPYDQASCQTGY